VYISIRDLELRKVAFRETFAPGRIEFFDKKLRQIGAVQVSGEAVLENQLRDIRVSGYLRVLLEFDCDRCLEAARLPLEGSFNLLYEPVEDDWLEQETALSPSDAEIGYYEGDGIDLADVIREQILLWLPMRRICSGECRGICPSCGQNRNFAECHCHSELDDPRWAALRALRSK
jgi:uncharacterized protein